MENLHNSMLKKGKKGFTLTELAIVIAVIAILIAVLVPTFTSIISNAKRTSAAETASHAITAYIGEQQTSPADNSIIAVEYDSSTTYYFTVTSGSITASEGTTSADNSELSKLYEYAWVEDDNNTSFSTVTIYVTASELGTATEVNAKTIADKAVETFYGTSGTGSSITKGGYVNVGNYWWTITYNSGASVGGNAESSAPTVSGYTYYTQTVGETGSTVTAYIYISNS